MYRQNKMNNWSEFKANSCYKDNAKERKAIETKPLPTLYDFIEIKLRNK